MQAVAQLRETITRVAGPNLLQQPQQPPIATFLDPVLQAVEQQGLDPAQLDDATVDQLYRQSLEQLPAEQAGLVAGLLPEGVEPATASANSGLALVFLDPDSVQGETSEMGAGPLLEVEQDMASAVEDLQLPGGVEADLFAFNLLLGDQDDFLDEVARLFAFAFLIILVILLFVFALRPRGGSALGAARRTLADVGLTLVVIILAIVWVQGFTGWLGPDGLGLIGAPAENSQILPVLLIGLGVDYAIHLTSRYREEIGQGYGVADAVGRATRTVGVALVLATATTAVGFLTNLVTPVPAIADFGVLAAVGIVAAFLLMLTLVPATRLLLDRRAERRGTLPRAACAATGDRALPGLMARLAVLAERAPVITLLVFVLGGGAVGVVGLLNLEASFSFTDFVPEGDPVVATFETLQDEFGGGFGETTDVLIDGDVATPATHNALVGALGETADVDNVITFGEQAAADSPVSVLGQVLAAAQQGGPGAGTPGEEGAPGQEGAPGGAAGAGLDPAAVSQVAQLAQQAGVGPDLRVDEGADVVALYEALLQAAPALASQVLPEGELDVARVSIRTQAGEDDAGELADDLNEVFAPVEDAAGEVVPTSQSIISDDIVTALQSSQLVSLAVSVIAAMVLLVANFWFESRRPMLGVLTIAPVALVVMWTFAAMAFTGIPFGPVTATIAALAIGIGVPYTIHVTHRFQEDRLRYASAEEAIRSTVRHTGGALAGSAFTTIAGFGILVTSSLTPFRQFGLVTAFAIGFALLAATIVLPSLLVLWDRWHRRRGDLEGRAVETGDGGVLSRGAHPARARGARCARQRAERGAGAGGPVLAGALRPGRPAGRRRRGGAGPQRRRARGHPGPDRRPRGRRPPRRARRGRQGLARPLP